MRNPIYIDRRIAANLTNYSKEKKERRIIVVPFLTYDLEKDSVVGPLEASLNSVDAVLGFCDLGACAEQYLSEMSSYRNFISLVQNKKGLYCFDGLLNEYSINFRKDKRETYNPRNLCFKINDGKIKIFDHDNKESQNILKPRGFNKYFQDIVYRYKQGLKLVFEDKKLELKN